MLDGISAVEERGTSNCTLALEKPPGKALRHLSLEQSWTVNITIASPSPPYPPKPSPQPTSFQTLIISAAIHGVHQMEGEDCQEIVRGEGGVQQRFQSYDKLYISIVLHHHRVGLPTLWDCPECSRN